MGPDELKDGDAVMFWGKREEADPPQWITGRYEGQALPSGSVVIHWDQPMPGAPNTYTLLPVWMLMPNPVPGG